MHTGLDGRATELENEVVFVDVSLLNNKEIPNLSVWT
jgi:hypothetical protein